MSTQVQISSLLEKMGSVDKDFRFMATNDLMGELTKEALKLDDEIERKITRTLLKLLLEDKNGEVQNLAVRCLGPLIHKTKYVNVELVVSTLCESLDSQTERSRDVSSIALKTVVSELSPNIQPQQVNMLLEKILPRMLDILRDDNKKDAAFKIEVAEILGIIVCKFGRVANINFADVIDVLFLQLSRDRQALRKRATTVLGHVADVLSEQTFVDVVDRVVTGVQKGGDHTIVRAHVSAAATISKSCPAFVSRLPQLVDAMLNYCRNTEDDELKEACLHAFEVFTCRCNKDITEFLPGIEEICSLLISYDPNYQYDEEEEESMEIDGGEDSEPDELDEYSDDDDFSWKVRRSAAKCFQAIITSKTDRLEDHYTTIAPLLLDRFKEREESVKVDVFRAYESLLKQTRLFLPEKLAQFDESSNISPFTTMDQKTPFSNAFAEQVLRKDVDSKQKAVLTALSGQVTRFVKVVCRQMKSRSSNVRLHCFSLLTALVSPGCLDGHFECLVALIKNTVADKAADNATKIDTLQFLNLTLYSHEPRVFAPHLDVLVDVTVRCVNDPFYKVSSAALTLIQPLILVLKHTGEQDKYLDVIYNVIWEKLPLSDIDQEVKERAIASAGILLAAFGEKLSQRLSVILPVLLEKLSNEMTRATTVQAFCVIVNSNEKVDLSSILESLLSHLADFLRKNQRALRISSLSLLTSLVTGGSVGVVPSGMEKVVSELPDLICEPDLYISQLALKLSKEMTLHFPAQTTAALPAIVKSCVTLANSSLLVGHMLQLAVDLFVTIVKSDVAKKPSFTELMDTLTHDVYTSKVSRQANTAVAVIMAYTTKAVGGKTETSTVVSGLVKILTDKDLDSLPIFALTALGELGRVFPACFDDCNVSPDALIADFFNSSSEETKTAASFALGALASGNLPKYLPTLLREIKTQPKRQYLLLHALKEVITVQSSSQSVSDVFDEVVEEVWTVLLGHSDCSEESTRNVVAECMGRLCRIRASRFLPLLIKCSQEGNQKQRSTTAAAVRFMIVDSSSTDNEFLRKNLEPLLRAITDDDLDVRRTTIMTLNSAAHNRPRWIKELLPELLPSLYKETAIKKELIHEVQMGPFKHIVDDGLDLRKSAYECMYTLMEHCLDRIDVFEYMSYMEEGLKDSHDIKLLNLLMLTRLAQTCSTQVAQRIDRFADLLAPLLILKAKETSVKQESDKIEELKRACIRTILALKRVSALDRSLRLQSIFEMVHNDQKLKAIMDSLERDSSLKLLAVHNADVNMDSDF